jgi:hypothetical protein
MVKCSPSTRAGHVIPPAVQPPHDQQAYGLPQDLTGQIRRVLTHRPLPEPSCTSRLTNPLDPDAAQADFHHPSCSRSSGCVGVGPGRQLGAERLRSCAELLWGVSCPGAWWRGLPGESGRAVRDDAGDGERFKGLDAAPDMELPEAAGRQVAPSDASPHVTGLRP